MPTRMHSCPSCATEWVAPGTRMGKGWGRRRTLWGLCLLTAGLTARTAAGQTLFDGPTAPPTDVSRYVWVEECLAATSRVQHSLENTAPILSDTMPLAYAVGAARAALPAPVVETARRCGARFEVATAPLDDFRPLLELYLEAGRDTEDRKSVV